MKKTILITGASSGIGRATAKFFQQKDWNVIATMRQPEKEEELGKLENVLVARLDVTDTSSIQSAVAEGLKKFGRIDALLNNAGFGAYGALEATSGETIRRQFETNVFGLLETTKAILPHFRANKEGIIVNISSMGGKIAFPLGTLYHGTKFAVEGISEALSYEMAAIGVKVKIVEPGMVKTDFGGRSFDFSNDVSLPEYQEVVGKVFAAFASTQDGSSEAIDIANVVYQAVTDGTDQLRYIAGKDAEALIAGRKAQDDKTFIDGVKDMFALSVNEQHA